MPVKPRKSTIMKLSTRSPVLASTVLIVQAAAFALSPLEPPTANASLIFAVWGCERVEPPCSHEAIGTHESRGKETTVARLPSAAVWSSMRVSDCMVVRFLP